VKKMIHICQGNFDWFSLKNCREATVGFIMSVRMEKLGSHRTDFD
jgi:hypothetical protein